MILISILKCGSFQFIESGDKPANGGVYTTRSGRPERHNTRRDEVSIQNPNQYHRTLALFLLHLYLQCHQVTCR